ncbi:hypothetical protein CSC94_15810 [Zhengella mangrovi]|uniref:Uncharacterized protein n=1 Tax=Zhengella mangrovi TaxID=1982044 RepID=A0A2G1QKL3_9HYPH|nr:hypothetical protein [Zhengella mangrovi]PHP66066.1 hypothetical protein CSC94_15810 [Zhengella mangrovi]
MLGLIPLLIIPFLIYNLGLAGVFGAADAPFSGSVFSMHMMSGGVFTMTVSDLIMVIALLLLFFEILKATRTNNSSVIDHLLSTFVFVAYLVEFLLVQGASTSLFFLLMVIALVDVLAGFSVSLRAAGRDVTFG